MSNSVNEDIRWKHRFNNYVSAMFSLTDMIDASKQKKFSQLGQLGVIRMFIIVHELAWKVLKDYLQEEGLNHNLIGPEDSTQAAFRAKLIENKDTWMEMIKARSDSDRSYEEEVAQEIFDAICIKFYPELEQLKKRFNKLYEQNFL